MPFHGSVGVRQEKMHKVDKPTKAGATNARKRTFSCPVHVQKQAAKIPRASECLTGPPPALPAPTGVRDRLSTGDRFIGIDVETDTLVLKNSRTWIQGRFGFKSTIEQNGLDAMRIIELG